MRVLITDDSSLYRKVLADCVKQTRELELVGQASDGNETLRLCRDLKPDLVTLDLEMPGLSGLQTLNQLSKEFPQIPVIMVSAHTKRGATDTIACLEAGAFGFITKPEGTSPQENIEFISTQLRLLSSSIRLSRTSKAPNPQSAVKPPLITVAQTSTDTSAVPPYKGAKVLVIGVSTGGPKALGELLPTLPAQFPLPILICQHMPPLFTASLAQSLGKKCKLPVLEAEHKQIVKNSHIYIAPGGRQMGVQTSLVAGSFEIVLTDDPPENHCRPSVDYLFRSTAQAYGGSVLAVILTGMGNDGTLGLKRLKRGGARVLAQDEASCVVFGMPKEAINAGVVDHIFPLTRMGEEILKHIHM